MTSKQVPPGWFIPFFLTELFLQWERFLIYLTIVSCEILKPYCHSLHYYFFSPQLGYGFKICSSFPKKMSLGNEVTWVFQLEKINSFILLAILFHYMLPPPPSNVWLPYFHVSSGCSQGRGKTRDAVRCQSFGNQRIFYLKEDCVSNVYL